MLRPAALGNRSVLPPPFGVPFVAALLDYNGQLGGSVVAWMWSRRQFVGNVFGGLDEPVHRRT